VPGQPRQLLLLLFMTGYEGPAVIMQGGRRVRIVCAISVSMGSWKGRFWSATPSLGPDVHYPKDIELDDGRLGKIIFTEVEDDRRGGRFNGSGPVPTK